MKIESSSSQSSILTGAAAAPQSNIMTQQNQQPQHIHHQHPHSHSNNNNNNSNHYQQALPQPPQIHRKTSAYYNGMVHN